MAIFYFDDLVHLCNGINYISKITHLGKEGRQMRREITLGTYLPAFPNLSELDKWVVKIYIIM